MVYRCVSFFSLNQLVAREVCIFGALVFFDACSMEVDVHWTEAGLAILSLGFHSSWNVFVCKLHFSFFEHRDCILHRCMQHMLCVYGFRI